MKKEDYIKKNCTNVIMITHNKIVEDIKKGDTIVHYFYRGESSLSSALRSHHCSPSTLCMVLENKGVCADSHLQCTTKYNCEGINCACHVDTSCGDERKSNGLSLCLSSNNSLFPPQQSWPSCTMTSWGPTVALRLTSWRRTKVCAATPSVIRRWRGRRGGGFSQI